MQDAEICIAGAGIIGLSLALELHRRGAAVTILERDTPLSHASIAAAGMLAAHDPVNPSPLEPLSELSVSLYPKFLSHIAELSGQLVPFQTSRTLQGHPTYSSDAVSASIPGLQINELHFRILEEYSIDPRQLAPALLAAVRNTSVCLLENTMLHSVTETGHDLVLQTTGGSLRAKQLVYAMGAWSPAPVAPRKGQMLSVALPLSFSLHEVVRTPSIYIVPRTKGPRAGNVLVGATIEDAGFDTTPHHADLARLRERAAQLIPILGDPALCPEVDSWAGLRPSTPDGLPLLGHHPASSRRFLATGHYRDGILLAPATAHVMAQTLGGEQTTVDLTPFSPARFPVV